MLSPSGPSVHSKRPTRSIDPLAYLTDVMPRLVDREAGVEIDDLLPRQWKAARQAA